MTAKVALSTIYQAFGSRADLFDAFIEDLWARTGLPVIVDPSHAPGRRDLVARAAKAAIAIGADGLIVEADENPDQALSDGPQQLWAAEFPAFVEQIRRIADAERRRLLLSGA